MKPISEKIKAILFDLDGTILDIDLDRFVMEYIKLLAKNVEHLIKPRKFIPYLLKASKALEENDGTKTNEQVYKEVFFPAIGLTLEELEPHFTKFYEEDFAQLRQWAKRIPKARELMQFLFDNGYDVVIATTPIIPETAIRQRLEWAGVADFPYKLITSYENTRATKPNLLYYTQILETIGHPPEVCMMVGDEDKDMVAAKLGITTFLIKSPQTKIAPTTPEPNYEGTLADLEELFK